MEQINNDANKNILVTSAGKRVELVLELKRELKTRYPDAKVVTVDLNPLMAPTTYVADKSFAVPRVTDRHYIEALIDICLSQKIRLIIPTIDTELCVLAENREKFTAIGVDVIVSDLSFVRLCRDKRLTNQFFEKVGIRTPYPVDIKKPTFPMFAKPYDGSLSTNIHVIKSKEDLTSEIINDPKLIFMELIDKTSYKEFTVDIYFDKKGDVKCIVPRERIEVRSGEINKGATRNNYLVNYLKDRIDHIEGVRGCICLQLFYRESDNDVVGIEINPRFGGGYPLSYYAGANYPSMMIKEYFNCESIDFVNDWKANTIMLRYDSQVIFNE